MTLKSLNLSARRATRRMDPWHLGSGAACVASFVLVLLCSAYPPGPHLLALLRTSGCCGL